MIATLSGGDACISYAQPPLESRFAKDIARFACVGLTSDRASFLEPRFQVMFSATSRRGSTPRHAEAESASIGILELSGVLCISENARPPHHTKRDNNLSSSTFFESSNFMTPSESREKTLERVMSRHQYSGSALIEVLHAAQQLYGYLSKPMLGMIAHTLRLPPSKVLGVATFYHLFRFAPVREHTAVVCLGTACYAAGGTELLAVVKRRGKESEWTVEAGRCVGSCGLAPVVICDGEALSRVSREALERTLERQTRDGASA